MQSFHDIWEPVLKALSEKFSETIMELWFNHLELAALSDTTVVLISDSDMKADIINKRHRETLADAFEEILGFPAEIVVISDEGCTLDRETLQHDVRMGLPVDVILEKTGAQTPTPSQAVQTAQTRQTMQPAAKQETPIAAAPVTEAAETAAAAQTDAGAEPKPAGSERQEQFYNSEYTFENFIVGSSNKFAHAACVAVANNPASAYNPLFIYGPSGLGKTHLLYAIINRILDKTPKANIVYVKGDSFTNDLIESLQNKSMPAFREKYRKADVLLIDDVHFIAGKDATQEEFFNTFNELYDAKKQIILTSDRPPKEINTLEDRLKTRFEWGLIADIQPPDMELRIAILRKKAQYMEVEISNDVLNYLAEKLKSNIRQIEGVIKRLGAYSNLTKQPITLEMARENIADVTTGSEPVKITQDKIFNAVSNKYGISVDKIRGKLRDKDIAMARHICMYIMRTVTDMSLPAIGKLFGGRDHTTVISSVTKIKNMMAEDASLENDIDALIKEITN
ncbi:MAG: chromosomal replication initiator protein DnaA [Clostridia bacterium]|nr:chromosomal replication initiator protein DnaA [Clostridia bacterium]